MMNLIRSFLIAAITTPIWYFGIQLLAAAFYPNYDFIRLAASELGSPDSNLPIVFNFGAMLGGLVTLLGAIGFWFGFAQTRTPRVLVWLICTAVVLVGLSSLWAGFYPLPDPRHGHNPFALFGLLPMPFLIAMAFWKFIPARVYLVFPILLLLSVMPFLSGFVPIDRSAYDGLLQRLAALASFMPIGIGAYVLLKRLNHIFRAATADDTSHDQQ
jgi:hypothetical membrane protein